MRVSSNQDPVSYKSTNQERVKQEGGLRAKGLIKSNQPSLPLISVITVTYNAAEFLPRTIKSIRNQTYNNFEWVVVDGNSSDSTISMLKENDDVIDYWVSEPDSGIYDAWNKGISKARGDWIAFLGSDDVYLSHALEQYVSYINNNADAQLDYISSKVEFVNLKGEVLQILGKPWSWKSFKRKMVVAHVGSLHSKRMYEKYGLYDVEYKSAADYEFLLRSRGELRAGFLGVITARMQNGGASNQMKAALEETKKAKHVTGGRIRLLCDFDNILDMAKIIFKNTFIKRYRC